MSPQELRIVPTTTGTPAATAGARVLPPAPRRRRRLRWVIGALAAVALAGAAQWYRTSTPAADAPHYSTTPVTRGSITRIVTSTGSVNPVTTIQVGTYVSGAIQEVLCDYNTVVRTGQLCAKIDPRPYETVVEQDRANLSTARAQLGKDQTNLEYARLTYQRTLGLRESGIVSQDAMDSARNAFDQATSQVELDKSTIDQHQAALHAAEINLAYTNIVSPVTGTVISRNVTMGQTVAASFQTPTLFLIATDLTKMQVDANVSESDIGGVRVGNAATFTVEAFPKRVFEGRVNEVRQAPQTVQNVVTYDVVVGVHNQDLALKPGMTATVRIVIERRDQVLRVPGAALRYAPGGLATSATRDRAEAEVWVLRGGRPASVPVAIGLDDDTYVELTKGDVHEGDEVITAEQANAGSARSRVPFFRL